MENDGRRNFLSLYAIVFAFLLLQSFAGDRFVALLDQLFGTQTSWLADLLLILITAFFAFFAYLIIVREAGRIMGSDARLTRSSNTPPRRVLITGYSPLSSAGAPLNDGEKSLAAVGGLMNAPFDIVAAPGARSESELTKWLAENGETTSAFGWQQNVRALAHHIDRLDAILVLDPAGGQWTTFHTFLKTITEQAGRPDLRIERITLRGADRPFHRLSKEDHNPLPADYEDYSYVYDGVRRGVEMAAGILELKPRAAEAHICIDVTPGLKMFSIGAATVTMNSDLLFSYITNNGEPKFYNSSISFSGASLV